ncbi:hypothetical protein AF72_06810 [Xylella taiwanensis]|uniref:Uncharacterized protein n=1 Tax=Xylella taiwanensis TaxID=1444770 RepID=Z9JJP3_9GAMM|nr:hypothetical protein AB672_07365 [Xylella taiwanensis]EWS78208.1 hypothetical protein AF72_06810 [Xylella taiwanensis]
MGRHECRENRRIYGESSGFILWFTLQLEVAALVVLSVFQPFECLLSFCPLLIFSSLYEVHQMVSSQKDMLLLHEK